MFCSYLIIAAGPDPTVGPQISGWEKYNPNNSSTLAILGISDSGAIPGDAETADQSCEYWNTILPIYPQVSSDRSKGAQDI